MNAPKSAARLSAWEQIDVEKSGFTHFSREPIQVLTNGDVRIDVQMQIGAFSQSVSVEASAPLMQVDTSAEI